MHTTAAVEPYTWVSDADWKALDDAAKHMDAGVWIRRALTHIADLQRDPDLWEAYHLDAAMRAMGEGAYRVAGALAYKALGNPASRDTGSLAGAQPPVRTLGEFEALFEANANRRPIPAARD